MHLPRPVFIPLHATQRLGLRHLEDKKLILAQLLFRDPVPGLDQRRLSGIIGNPTARHGLNELPQIAGIDAGVAALIDDLEDIIAPDQRQRNMKSTRSPAPRDRHLRRRIRHLVTRDRHRLQQLAPHFLLRRFVDKAKIVALFIFDILYHTSSSSSMMAFARRTAARTLLSPAWNVT